MTVQLDHTIVPSRNKAAAAKLLGGLLGVPWSETGLGPFAPVYVNDGLTLDFIDTNEDFPVYHFCFRVGQAEFDAILGRIKAAGIKYRSNVHGPVDMQVGAQYGNFYWNEPDGHQWELLTTSYARPPAERPMHDDDRQTGRILTRREALALLGTAGAAMLAGRASWVSAAEPALACVASPAQTEGPYFVDERLNRSDIRSDPADGSTRQGLPLTLTLTVAAVSGSQCSPLAGAMVDIWHCDLVGAYSDARDPGFNTVGKKFLRGYQVTDAAGSVRFTTIYPGWYDGRTVHIHFKVRGAAAAKRSYEFTSQLYFDDALTDRVYARDPYTRRARRTVRNGGDGIFRAGGSRLILPVVENDAGYAGNFNIGLKLA